MTQQSAGIETVAAVPGEPVVAPPVRGGGLGDKAAAGFALLVFQTLVVRAVRMVGSIVLAWLLFPDDFALFGTATILHMFVSVLKNAGLRDILVQRQARVRKWINPAVWMSAGLGVGGGLIMVAAAPALAWFFERPDMIPLVLVLAATTPVQSLGQVPTALLHAQLRFKTLANIEAANNIALMAFQVYFAWAGLGALSFVLPMLLLALLRTAYTWWLVRPATRWNPQFRRWRYLVGDSARLIAGDIARTVTFQGDYVVMARAFPGSAAVGHYFYAFNLSSQFVQLLARNMDTVLFPALAHIQSDAKRHFAAYLKALHIMTVVGIPLCMLQAATAEPVVNAILPERFHPTVPYVVLLSMGMGPRFAIVPAVAMLRSEGRFKAFFTLNWVFAALVVGLAVVGALFGSPIGVAAGVVAAMAIAALVFVFVTLRPHGKALRRTLMVFAWPTILGGGGCAAGWWASQLLPQEGIFWQLARAGVVCVVAAGVYIPLIRVVEPEACRELTGRVMRLVRRRGARKAAAD